MSMLTAYRLLQWENGRLKADALANEKVLGD